MVHIHVYARCRPIDADQPRSIHVAENDTIEHKSQSFRFDHIWDDTTTQTQVFEYLSPQLDDVVTSSIKHVTILMYGLTGSGKTTLLTGTSDDYGVIFRFVQQVFNDQQSTSLMCSYIELYNDSITDLLSSVVLDKSPVYEEKKSHRFVVPGLSDVSITSFEHFCHVFNEADGRRRVRATNFNQRSSRSHTLLQLFHPGNNTQYMFVDLAGSERLNTEKTTTVAEQRETQHINSSLLCLGKIIYDLGVGKRVTSSFRSHFLTRFLKPIFVGVHSKLFLILTLTPSMIHEQQTLATLRFGQRAKMIKPPPPPAPAVIPVPSLGFIELERQILLLEDEKRQLIQQFETQKQHLLRQLNEERTFNRILLLASKQ